jgi:hypothetical protein
MIENKCMFFLSAKRDIYMAASFPRPVPGETNASMKEKSYDMVGCIIS